MRIHLNANIPTFEIKGGGKTDTPNTYSLLLPYILRSFSASKKQVFRSSETAHTAIFSHLLRCGHQVTRTDVTSLLACHHWNHCGRKQNYNPFSSAVCVFFLFLDFVIALQQVSALVKRVVISPQCLIA